MSFNWNCSPDGISSKWVDLKTMTKDKLQVIEPGDNKHVTFSCNDQINDLYQVKFQLGSGAYGAVYKVCRMGTGGEFALKATKVTHATGIKSLNTEYDLLKQLYWFNGFPRVHNFIDLGYAKVMLVDLQETDLQKMMEMDKSYCLGPQQAAKVAEQILHVSRTYIVLAGYIRTLSLEIY